MGEVYYPDMQKLYIEPSTLCNLDCTMCMRRSWDGEPMGLLDMGIYRRLIAEAAGIESIKTVFFGGIGEPTYHPDFAEMVALASAAGKRVECVSNGTLMDYDYLMKLAKAGMNQIWVSVDGFSKESYEDIRINGDFAKVRENIKNIFIIRRSELLDFHLGLTFVAMKSNAAEMGKLMDFAWAMKAKDVKISHVLPYSQHSVDEALYNDIFMYNDYRKRRADIEPGESEGHGVRANLDMPLFDLNEDTIAPLARLFKAHGTYSIMGDPIVRKTDYCRFVREGNVFVKWDGTVTQCMALLHPSTSYLGGNKRITAAHSFGDLRHSTLQEIWNDAEYKAFRERVRDFDFSLCTQCNSCSLVESNQEDCIGNHAPTCGACLWAQGFIQCP